MPSLPVSKYKYYRVLLRLRRSFCRKWKW